MLTDRVMILPATPRKRRKGESHSRKYILLACRIETSNLSEWPNRRTEMSYIKPGEGHCSHAQSSRVEAVETSHSKNVVWSACSERRTTWNEALGVKRELALLGVAVILGKLDCLKHAMIMYATLRFELLLKGQYQVLSSIARPLREPHSLQKYH